MEKITYFIMVPMVYTAFAVLVLGTLSVIVGIARAPRQTTTLKIFPEKAFPLFSAAYDTFAMPTIRKDRPLFWVWLILYHIAFALLIVGHLDLFPGVNVMRPDSNHMIGYGGVGVILTLSMLYFLFRRLKSPVREISTFGDYLLLILLLFIFLTGGLMSWSNSWNENGFVLLKSDFKKYFAILRAFSFENPHPYLQSSHYIHVVLHVFLANCFLMVFPFTKFTHTFLAMAANRLRRS